MKPSCLRAGSAQSRCRDCRSSSSCRQRYGEIEFKGPESHRTETPLKSWRVNTPAGDENIKTPEPKQKSCVQGVSCFLVRLFEGLPAFIGSSMFGCGMLLSRSGKGIRESRLGRSLAALHIKQSSRLEASQCISIPSSLSPPPEPNRLEIHTTCLGFQTPKHGSW